ncbi:hypothetical protein NIES2119_11200 [[Phormidium ambiguum] IAM M-71]|uniref:DUF3891 domain-containing protein n=1 Tax=[Phormidium ambiguum] IAM M-71 TaxID=454136 RepID=A0A1U7ILM7_9CYAN|nr:DUF3891 family protein [Phormidium ambiguum]OKH38116.1 hypothetical protein NIES2119_11200 [Phormidium ambiguum IAM M-71]
MLLRLSSPEEVICITQPHHAWIAGQLARAWGNEKFGQVSPNQQVCLAAEQHDIGWIHWEQASTLNPQTGYPHSFSELATKNHINIWSKASNLALPWGRYVALLISLHGTRLYERFRGWENSPETKELVENFLKVEYGVQEDLISKLQNDSYYEQYATPEIIKRNQKLVAVWDALSLIICHGFTGEKLVENVPTADGEITLTLTAKKDCPLEIFVSPWPFRENRVNLVLEGRLLQQKFTDETMMREALNQALTVTIDTILIPENSESFTTDIHR